MAATKDLATAITSPPTRDRAQRRGRISVTIAIVVAGVAGLVNGIIGGMNWAEGAERIAYWAERGTGSTGWVDQLGASIGVGLGGFLVAVAGGAVVRLALARGRGAAMLALVVATTVALVLGFLGAAGVGGELGLDAGELPGMVIGTAFSVLLGASAGYGFGSLLMRPAKPLTRAAPAARVGTPSGPR